jgi:hypothetical protein
MSDTGARSLIRSDNDRGMKDTTRREHPTRIDASRDGVPRRGLQLSDIDPADAQF